MLSTLILSFLVYGFHTEDAYSSCGRTRLWYALSLTATSHGPKFLRIKPSVLDALARTASICLVHDRSDEIVTPRYFVELSLGIATPSIIYA